ncbi:MAG: hypothetical protein FWG44_01160 [Oscillospiraceae bacterium]|nr:hypothetical protein [Oscillospiraceae bacterium]
MRKLSNLKSKKGMTLVELLTGIAMLSFLMIMITSILMPTSRVQSRVIDLAEMNTLLDNVSNPIIKDLSSATSVVPGSMIFGADDLVRIPIGNTWVEYTVDPASGILMRETNRDGGVSRFVLSPAYYRNKSITFAVTDAGLTSGTGFILTVIILSDTGEELADRSYAIKPLAVNSY